MDAIAPISTAAAVPSPELTVLMPCLNEQLTVGRCVRRAVEVCAEHGIAAEVLIADNGSTDSSQQLAREAGARVIDVAQRGYGAALLAGIEAARGRFVVMADSDDSYEFGDIPALLRELRAGGELVMGSRFRGTIHPGAMPFLHRFVGNPVLTFILNFLFGAGISDVHCGLRGFSREAIRGLNLRSTGMEFASEMIIRAAQERLSIREVPTSLRPDGRDRRPHLRTFRDGWRHLRFMLLFSPLWLFVAPGLVASVLGMFLMIAVAFFNVTIFGHILYTHFALLGSTLTMLGLQLVLLGVFAKSVFVLDGIGQNRSVKRLLTSFRLEFALLGGLALFLAGVGIDVFILSDWLATGRGVLLPHVTHVAILGGTLAIAGVELTFGSFFLSILAASRTGRWV